MNTNFKKGQRVCFSQEWLRQGHKQRFGTVIGLAYSFPGVTVVLDGQKTRSAYHWQFLSPVALMCMDREGK